MPQPFIGNHPALDFLNTAYGAGVRVENIADGRAYLDWLVAAGVLDRTTPSRLLRRFGSKAMDVAAADARQLREWARQWLVRWRMAPERSFEREVAELNTMLARGSWSCRLVADGSSYRLAREPCIDSADSLLAVPARWIADLLVEAEPSRIRSCAGAGCTLWFVDRSKSHRRLFCSARTCGNRHKVAAFRERQA